MKWSLACEGRVTDGEEGLPGLEDEGFRVRVLVHGGSVAVSGGVDEDQAGSGLMVSTLVLGEHIRVVPGVVHDVHGFPSRRWIIPVAC